MEQPNSVTIPMGAEKSLAESSSDITSSSNNEEGKLNIFFFNPK